MRKKNPNISGKKTCLCFSCQVSANWKICICAKYQVSISVKEHCTNKITIRRKREEEKLIFMAGQETLLTHYKQQFWKAWFPNYKYSIHFGLANSQQSSSLGDISKFSNINLAILVTHWKEIRARYLIEKN